MNGVNRFAIAILMMLSGYWTVVAQQQMTAPDKKNAVLVSGGALVLQKGYSPTCIAEFRPVADLFYHRMLGTKWGIGVGYAYSEFDPVFCFVKLNDRTYSTKFDCLQQNHSCLIAPDYSLDFNYFNVNPYVAMGRCWTKFTFGHNNNRTDKQTCFMLSPGIRLGYNMGSWMAFASYHFDYCFIYTYYYPYITTADGDVDFNRGHHSFNFGVGYKF